MRQAKVHLAKIAGSETMMGKKEQLMELLRAGGESSPPGCRGFAA
jgi:hypothetical protein